MTDLQTAHEAYRREAGVCDGCRERRETKMFVCGPGPSVPYHSSPFFRCAADSFEVWADQRDKALRAENERLQKALDEKLTTGVESPARESVKAGTYVFYSPLDMGTVSFADIDKAREAAQGYIGGEDWEGEVVTELPIYSMSVFEVVRSAEIKEG